MAQLKDILETEKLRADMAQCLCINLFKEGTFYRAYEWSAWLCVRYIKQFKPTYRHQRKNLKSHGGFQTGHFHGSQIFCEMSCHTR